MKVRKPVKKWLGTRVKLRLTDSTPNVGVLGVSMHQIAISATAIARSRSYRSVGLPDACQSFAINHRVAQRIQL